MPEQLITFEEREVLLSKLLDIQSRDEQKLIQILIGLDVMRKDDDGNLELILDDLKDDVIREIEKRVEEHARTENIGRRRLIRTGGKGQKPPSPPRVDQVILQEDDYSKRNSLMRDSQRLSVKEYKKLRCFFQKENLVDEENEVAYDDLDENVFLHVKEFIDRKLKPHKANKLQALKSAFRNLSETEKTNIIKALNEEDLLPEHILYENFQDVLKDYKFPIIYNFPAGHIKDNRALILGKTVTIDVTDKESSLKFD